MNQTLFFTPLSPTLDTVNTNDAFYLSISTYMTFIKYYVLVIMLPVLLYDIFRYALKIDEKIDTCLEDISSLRAEMKEDFQRIKRKYDDMLDMVENTSTKKRRRTYRARSFRSFNENVFTPQTSPDFTFTFTPNDVSKMFSKTSD